MSKATSQAAPTAATAPPRPLVLAAATASGKSELALRIAERTGAHIVNLDPFQALDGLPLLTAQPSAQEQARAPHHLYGCLPISSALSAASFAELVEEKVAELAARQQRALLVSGSGLYIRAWTHGIDRALPASDPELLARFEARSLEENLHALQALDPVEWAQIDRANPVRVLRSLVLCTMLKAPVSTYKQPRDKWQSAPSKAVHAFYLHYSRARLHERINERCKRLFDSDLVLDEVRCLRESLQQSGQALGSSAQKIIGLKAIEDALDGKINAAEAQAITAAHTRQYAKRQQNWFRKETWLTRLEPEHSDPLEPILALLDKG